MKRFFIASNDERFDFDDRFVTLDEAREMVELHLSRGNDHLGDPTIADAICDRIVHNAHRIDLKGPSRRKEKPSSRK